MMSGWAGGMVWSVSKCSGCVKAILHVSSRDRSVIVGVAAFP